MQNSVERWRLKILAFSAGSVKIGSVVLDRCGYGRGTMKNPDDKKIRFHEQEMEYRKGFKWYVLPYSDIANAYMRIEEVNGRLCCGSVSFDMHFLMLRTSSGELLKIEVSSRERVREMLEQLRVKNEKIKIGKKNES